jgi:hypothetical protein
LPNKQNLTNKFKSLTKFNVAPIGIPADENLKRPKNGLDIK